MTRRIFIRVVMGIFIGGFLWLLLVLPSLTTAAPSTLPIRPTPKPTATPDIPPTATPIVPPTAVPSPTPVGGQYDSDPMGAFIGLHVAEFDDQLWTVVQWQDFSGMWHDVSGWQGSLEPDGCKVWWLPGYLFGRGPFRWVIYKHYGGNILENSEPFYLPYVSGTKQWVNMDGLQ